MKRILNGLPILMLLAAVQTASAAGGPHQPPDFSEIDTDGSGTLTLEEFTAPMLEHASERFAEIDTNDDGVVTEAELDAAPRRRPHGPNPQ